MQVVLHGCSAAAKEENIKKKRTAAARIIF